MYKPNINVIFQRVDNDLLLLHLRTNRFYALNPTAARVWELVSSGLDVDRVVAELATEFNEDATVLRADVERLMYSMHVEELLTEQGIAATAVNR